MTTYPLERWMHEADFARMQADVTHIKDDVAEIKTDLNQRFVTKDQFTPVRNLVYGVVSLMLIGVVTGLLTLVVIAPG